MAPGIDKKGVASGMDGSWALFCGGELLAGWGRKVGVLGWKGGKKKNRGAIWGAPRGDGGTGPGGKRYEETAFF